MSKKRLLETKKNIVFIGHMGSGKSTIGKSLSKKLNIDFYDIDRVIEDETKQKITEIFANQGEEVFRVIEKKITMKVLRKKNTIIALGGGGLEDLKVREAILSNCISIWLKCDLNILKNRCMLSKKRPLLRNKNIKQELTKLDKKRKSNYSKAKFTIDVSKKNKNQIITEIIKILEI